MSEKDHSHFSVTFPTLSIGIGVFWYVWGVYGFWWGLCYGFFWPIWAGFRLAAYLLGHV